MLASGTVPDLTPNNVLTVIGLYLHEESHYVDVPNSLVGCGNMDHEMREEHELLPYRLKHYHHDILLSLAISHTALSFPLLGRHLKQCSWHKRSSCRLYCSAAWFGRYSLLPSC